MLRSFTLAAMLLLVPAVLRAQAAPVAEGDKPIIRAYDLTDLFRVPRNYPLPPSMIPATHVPQSNTGGGGGGGGGQSLFGMPGEMPEMGAVAQQPVTAESIA